MRPPNLSDQELAALYQECLDSLTVNGLEEVGRLSHENGCGVATRKVIQATAKACLERGMTKKDVAQLIILNGITLMAVTLFKERSAKNN